MTKKHLVFIILLTLIAVLLWIVGEILIVTVFHLGGRASVFWTILMIAATLGISLWKGLKDENEKNSRKW